MRRMARRLSVLLVAALVLAAPAAGDLGSQKRTVDTRLQSVQARIAAARAKESALSAQIASVTTRIRSLESQVGDVSTRLAVLESDLALHQKRLDKLAALFRLETDQLHFLQRQYRQAIARLDERVVGIYESDEPSTIDILLASRSFQELLDQLDYLSTIASQDKRIALDVRDARDQVHAARAKTKRVKTKVSSETAVIRVRTDQVAAVRDRLLASKHQLSTAEARKRHELASTQESEKSFIDEADALNAQSAQLAARIQAAQASAPAPTPSSAGSTSAPSSSGLIWPVNGPVTSPFGMRWGRMHQGIDIGVPYGTPIHAAAAGTVIYCGWMEGYGNLVVIDHHNTLATAYAHQSSIAVQCGQDVSQGQVIGYVGCTGHCTGPHLHFEVRVNGVPVDPLGYL
jgi:murein DD-endopeptidase MepM/ murein hydrolase activator NlpD